MPTVKKGQQQQSSQRLLRSQTLQSQQAPQAEHYQKQHQQTQKQEPEPSNTSPEDDATRNLLQNDVQEILETDLCCAICRDLYINPLILNCSHSFCKFCVYHWLSRQTGCPSCRVTVTFQAENLALRNVINKLIQKSSQQYQTTRGTAITQRLKDEEQQQKDGVVPRMIRKPLRLRESAAQRPRDFVVRFDDYNYDGSDSNDGAISFDMYPERDAVFTPSGFQFSNEIDLDSDDSDDTTFHYDDDNNSHVSDHFMLDESEGETGDAEDDSDENDENFNVVVDIDSSSSSSSAEEGSSEDEVEDWEYDEEEVEHSDSTSHDSSMASDSIEEDDESTDDTDSSHNTSRSSRLPAFLAELYCNNDEETTEEYEVESDSDSSSMMSRDRYSGNSTVEYGTSSDESD